MSGRSKMAIGLFVSLLASLTCPADEEARAVRKHWFVSGQVQGVGFRAFTFEAARELKVKGWVRNLTDRRVEIVAEGNEKDIAALLDRVKKGPQFGRVDGVKEAKVDEKEKLGAEFEIRDSAEPPKQEG